MTPIPTSKEQLQALADHLANRRNDILSAWRVSVDRDSELTTASTITRIQFIDHIPAVLDAFEDRLRAEDSAERLRAAVEALGSRMGAEGGPVFTLSIGFAAFPFLPHDPNALSWEQTLELADHGLRLTKTRRNSYTGLRATAGLSAASVLEFLAAGGGAPPPVGMEIVVPGGE